MVAIGHSRVRPPGSLPTGPGAAAEQRLLDALAELDRISVKETKGAQSNRGSVFSSAVPIALTAAAVDGPIPIGDVVGAVILAGATAYDATQRTFVTYTMRNAAGQTYVGRTSG